MAWIEGRDRFDILDRGRTLARYRNGRIKFPADSGSISQSLSILIGNLYQNFEGGTLGETEQTSFAKGLAGFMSHLVSELQEMGAGTSVVLVRQDEESFWESPWSTEDAGERLPLTSQLRRLAPKLKQYQRVVASVKEIGGFAGEERELSERGERIISRLLPLAKLDGATILYASGKGLLCSPANQLIPLIGAITSVDSRNRFVPLDIFSPSPEDENIEASLPQTDFVDQRLTAAQLRLIAYALQGQRRASGPVDEAAENLMTKLSFLNIAGTRHHSLWGITVTAREPVIAITISQDGDLRIFCDGRVWLPQG